MAALLHTPCHSSFLRPISPSLAFHARHRIARDSPRFSVFQTGLFHWSPLRVCAASKIDKTTTTESTEQPESFLTDLKEKWDAVENKPTLLAYGGIALVTVWVSATVISAVNSVPLLPKLLELVGLGYALWFVYRFLLFKENRKELIADIEELKSKITGCEKD